jgi:hypothetical protein
MAPEDQMHDAGGAEHGRVLRDLDELHAEAVDLDHRIEHHLRRLRAIAGGEPSARQVSRPPEQRSGRRPDGNSRAS